MIRRDFIKTAGAVVASAALPPSAMPAQETAPGRSILPINRNWRYHPARGEGAESPDFDDSKFERVVIPHTNIELPWHNFDDKDYEFISTYRRRFRFPKQAEGKRVFVDFEGVMTASTVWINGIRLGEYRGGFTPFSFELTKHLRKDGDNVLVVQVDSTERADIPPFGYEIDYMTFGGMYREVSLRIVPATYIDNICVQPGDVLSGNPSLDVSCFIAGEPVGKGVLAIEAELRDGDKVIAKASRTLEQAGIASGAPATDASLDPYNDAAVYATTETLKDPARHTVSMPRLANIQLWDLASPRLYSVHVRLLRSGRAIDEDMRRIGFREAAFTDHGFSLNGKIVKLRGLDRHQTFPFVGQAMPARVQRKDADILRKNLHCNIVRTSHYPQSRHFLDRCDEIGLLVLEEIPGWQHIGDESWKQVAIDNVGRMIRRDWNHPSNPQYAGGIGWCAFDYDTHANFGSGDRICYHGVTDIFREPKPAAGFYKSQCDPEEEIVLEPAFHWARGDESVGFTRAVFCSNCDRIKISIRGESLEASPWVPLAELDPDRTEFEHLKYPPFVLDFSKIDTHKVRAGWGDLRAEGFIAGKLVITRTVSGRGVDRKFALIPDDVELIGDGADTTRVVLRVTDEFGNLRTYANDPIAFTLDGPARLIGDNPFALIGGTGAVWVRAGQVGGTVRLTARHPRLGEQTVNFILSVAPEETA